MSKTADTLELLVEREGQIITNKEVSEKLGVPKNRASQLLFEANLIDGVYRVGRGMYVYSPHKAKRKSKTDADKVRAAITKNGGLISYTDLKKETGLPQDKIFKAVYRLQRTLKSNVRVEKFIIMEG